MQNTVWILFLMIAGCVSSNRPDLASVELKTIEGAPVKLIVEDEKLTVFVFMSPECPLCISYSSVLLELNEKFKNSGVIFYTIYPGTFYTAEQIKEFQLEYDFHLKTYLDPTSKFAKLFNATVTPEVFLLSKQGEVMYSGAIDDWAFAPGKKRQVTEKKYLENAINHVLAGEIPEPSQTEAIGCYIE
jgi:thiol-disulfide isomerase/thioredoxin